MSQRQLPPEVVQAIRDGKWVYQEPEPADPAADKTDREFWVGDDPVDAPEGWELAYAPKEG